MTRLLALAVPLLLVACGAEPAPDQPAQLDSMIGLPVVTTNDLERELAELKQENVRLRPQAKSHARSSASKTATKPSFIARVKTARSPMCYRDYCPCRQPQEGMDTILCDQLEAGIDVPIESMIAGRGGREYRRQMASGKYDF